jgi:hypothetical protein
MTTATKKKRKEEAYPWKAGASSWQITKLKQSILETFDIYGQSIDIERKYRMLKICYAPATNT